MPDKRNNVKEFRGLAGSGSATLSGVPWSVGGQHGRSTAAGHHKTNTLSDNERRIVNFIAENRTINVMQAVSLPAMRWHRCKKFLHLSSSVIFWIIFTILSSKGIEISTTR
jgi:hypothetical protein